MLLLSSLVSLLVPSLLAVNAHAFDFNDLKALAEKKSSVQETVAALPAELRSNYVLMHRSRSIQKGSPENPRAITFNNDASLVVSFTGEDHGGDHLEVMTFKNDRFDFKTIAFDENGRSQVNESPQNCFGCHGRIDGDLKPVWDPGLIWRGAYGSHDDTFTDPATIDEADAYAKFVTQASPTYTPLDLQHRVGAGDRHLIENRPNLRLGLLLMRQQAKRIARLMGPGALAKMCATLKSQSTVSPIVQRNLARFLPPIYGDGFAKNFLAEEAPGLSQTLAAVEASGVSPDEVPLTVELRTSAVFDASFPFRDLLFGELARREGKTVPFAKLTESRLGLRASPALQVIDQVGLALPEAGIQPLCQM